MSNVQGHRSVSSVKKTMAGNRALELWRLDPRGQCQKSAHAYEQ